MDISNKLVGILTPKDLLSRIASKGLNPDKVLISEVMTPNPETVTSNLTLLDALKEMHDQKFLHLPVRDENTGLVVGLVDVMELVCSTAGGEEKVIFDILLCSSIYIYVYGGCHGVGLQYCWRGRKGIFDI
jgi:signal-transduction protein with cAMP-binding, CBS, and nucleotidyltransferase domain